MVILSKSDSNGLMFDDLNEVDYYPINSYGIIGDLHTIALISPEGGIHWACFPFFDSPSLFAKILDYKKGGSFRLSPCRFDETQMNYLGSTNILQTTFLSRESKLILTDFMPIGLLDGRKEEPQAVYICRELHCIYGSDVEIDIFFDPAPDYARSRTTLHCEAKKVWSEDLPLRLCLSASAAWTKDARHGRLTLSRGDRVQVVFCFGKFRSSLKPADFYHEEFQRTRHYWQNWIRRSLYKGRWQDRVERSALVLKLMTFSPTGAIIAAPTTSLPESIGSERNWDYRFSWLRDSALTLNALFLLGYHEEAKNYMNWISNVVCGHTNEIQILYPIGDRDTTPETFLNHLYGYKGSQPVRIGNAAVRQVQIDVYGEVLDFFYLYCVYGEPIKRDLWRYAGMLADKICQKWHTRDAGIWEMRDSKKHFTFSKLMCWVGLDRAIRMAEEFGFPGNLSRWKTVKKEVADCITTSCVDPARREFVQSAETMEHDASNL